MKKTYIAPCAKTFIIKTQKCLLDTSNVGVSSQSFDSEKGTILGRGSDFEDED